MPSPSVDTMWQEIRMLKARVCELERNVVTLGQLPSTSYEDYVQFIACVDGMPSGSTSYVIPFVVVVKSVYVYNNGAFVQPQKTPTDPDLNFTVVYGATDTTVFFWKNGIASAPSCGNRVVIVFDVQGVHSAGGGQPPPAVGSTLVLTSVTADTTGDILTVLEMGIFKLAIKGQLGYGQPPVVQNGQDLNFALLGGVTIGEKLEIFHYV